MRLLFTFFILIILIAPFTGLSQNNEGILLTERTINPKSISIYPNPAVDFIEVNLDHLSTNKTKVTLYNIIGNEIKADTEILDEHKLRIKVKEFSAGYYFIAIRDEEYNFKGTYKFLKR